LYELVGTSKSATFDDIKANYKQKALELHPDRNPDCKDCQQRFTEVSKAYEVLMNPESRRYYDKVY
jgi:molecular chaperone DnaJ